MARKMRSAVLYMENHKGPRQDLQNLRPLWIPLPIKAEERSLLAQGWGGMSKTNGGNYFGDPRGRGLIIFTKQ